MSAFVVTVLFFVFFFFFLFFVSLFLVVFVQLKFVPGGGKDNTNCYRVSPQQTNTAVLQNVVCGGGGGGGG